MTDQEFFDTTIRHFVSQGRPAISVIGSCQYRTGDGLKCAVGCHIPDDLYDPKMDKIGMGVNTLISTFPFVRRYIPNHILAGYLQGAHDNMDNWDDPSRMIRDLQEIARKFNLNTDVLNSLDFRGIHK